MDATLALAGVHLCGALCLLSGAVLGLTGLSLGKQAPVKAAATVGISVMLFGAASALLTA